MKDQLIGTMKNAIAKVILGEETSVSLEGVYLSDIKACIEELGGSENADKFETNGWQWDFWSYYDLKGLEYMCSGSGYYGKLTFTSEI